MNSLHPEPLPEAAPPPPPPRLWPARLLWTVVIVGLMSLGWRYRLPILVNIQGLGQRLASTGDLVWRDPAGSWHPVEAADAARLTWTAESAFLTVAWVSAAPGLSTATLSLARPPHPQSVSLGLVRVDPKQWRIRAVGAPDWAERRVPDFMASFGLSAAINASFFSDEGPIGLVVQDGVRRHRQASRKAAHLFVDAPGGAVRIVNQRQAPVGALYSGIQGFPSMMSNGKLFSYVRSGGRGFDVRAVDRRSAACTDAEGQLLLIATDTLTNGLSFAELGVVLGGLGCVDAIALDGGSSTALEVPLGPEPISIIGVKPVQVVLGISPL